jgi:branched-chain amino acid transport system substrate-binding protein
MGPRPAAGQAPAPTPGLAEWRFGALFPLSGPLALLGDESVRGLELATEERNAAAGLLGRPIRVVRTDVSEPAQAQAEARRLCAATGPERPVALFGTLDSQLALAASQAAELARMPYFELVANADAMMDRDFRMLFRNCPRATELANTALEALPPIARLIGAGEASALRLGILHEDTPTTRALAESLEARVRDLDLTLSAHTGHASQSAAEIAAALRRLRAADTQVLLHCSRGTSTIPLFRALREGAWQPRVIIGLAGRYAQKDLAQALGPELDGTLIADLPQPAISDRFAPGVAAFTESYRRRFGAEPRSGHSLACYGGAMLFYNAIQRAGATDPARIRAAILALDLPIGTQPNGWGARFDERGQNGRARTVVLQWRDGALRTVLPADAAVAPLNLRWA